MRDSNLSPVQIENWLKEAPVRQQGENILTCPVRLAFPVLKELTPNKQKLKDGQPVLECSATLIFPPQAGQVKPDPTGEVKKLVDFWTERARSSFPNQYTNGKMAGIRNPFRDQSEKYGQLAGFNEEGLFLNCSTLYEPTICDINQEPIPRGPSFDERVYAGVWALVSLNTYSYDRSGSKGVSLGLAAVMIIGSDKRLSGGPIDAKQAFKGVNLKNVGNASKAFGASQAKASAENKKEAESLMGGATQPASSGPVYPLGAPASEMRAKGTKADVLIRAGYSSDDVISAGYSADELVEAGVL